MSAATEPETEAARLAPPPPGTVVWSILSWPELLADFGWLEGRWAPLDGRPRPGNDSPAADGNAPSATRHEHAAARMPDVRGSVLTGKPAIQPVTEAAVPQSARGSRGVLPALPLTVGQPADIPLSALHAFVIL
jgi:hypothetical protein